ncbi:hypothetical protein [uncultured Desulfuromusa sp.]|uniref:hypothetical protein n=1 Tax=uncultured Desulfuromusa sp. TaxID=219183 RepID=UPI003747F5FB
MTETAVRASMSVPVRLAIFVRLVQDSANDNKAMVAKLKEKKVVMIWIGSMVPIRQMMSRVGMVLFVFGGSVLGVADCSSRWSLVFVVLMSVGIGPPALVMIIFLCVFQQS